MDAGTKARYLSENEEQRLFNALKARDEDIKAARARGNQFRQERGYELMTDLYQFSYADRVNAENQSTAHTFWFWWLRMYGHVAVRSSGYAPRRNLPVARILVYRVGNYFGARMTDYSLTPEAETLVCTELQKAFPNALGIYAFGSRVQGTANAQSDLDLAVLVAGYADTLQLFEMANQLADKLGYEVDLLDLRAASTVMQHQVITTGRRLWAKDVQADLFDVFVLNEKLDFDELRAEQLNEIRETGRIYGK